MNNLRAIRQKRKKTQIAVQMVTGIDQSLLSKFERGERTPTADDLCRLADYYHTSTDYLLGRTDEEAPYPPRE